MVGFFNQETITMKNNHFKLSINILFLTWLAYQMFTATLLSADDNLVSRLMIPKDFANETKDLHGQVIEIPGRVSSVWSINLLWLRYYQIADENGDHAIWIKVQGGLTLPSTGDLVLARVVVKEAFHTDSGYVARLCTEISRITLESIERENIEPQEQMEDNEPGTPIYYTGY